MADLSKNNSSGFRELWKKQLMEWSLYNMVHQRIEEKKNPLFDKRV